MHPQPENQHTNVEGKNDWECKGLWEQLCPIMFSDYVAYIDAMHSLKDIVKTQEVKFECCKCNEFDDNVRAERFYGKTGINGEKEQRLQHQLYFAKACRVESRFSQDKLYGESTEWQEHCDDTHSLVYCLFESPLKGSQYLQQQGIGAIIIWNGSIGVQVM